ncbi:hypothetical protein [Bradyrhizobium sp.]|uniref:hypothetical protein n=1 Tax=Bradyrhizobium sp. TaxID=376 RepID=UPI003C43293E
MYRTLAADEIIATLARLEQRIGERFPGAGLARVCAELTEIARQTHRRSGEIARPNLWLRSIVGIILVAGAALLAFVGVKLWSNTKTSDDLYGTLQGIDAGFNILVLMGAALFFLFNIEEMIKRRRALKALHELRSIIHVIDMHQLTKDPSTKASVNQPTTSSPKRSLTPYVLRILCERPQRKKVPRQTGSSSISPNELKVGLKRFVQIIGITSIDRRNVESNFSTRTDVASK